MRHKTQAKYETKSIPAFILKADGDSGIVEAIVSVMGVLDLGNDVIWNGAYVKTIAERGNKIRVLNAHRTFSVLDVIGRPLDIREIGRNELPSEVTSQFPDATGGLYTKTQYALEVPEGDGVYKRIKASLVDEYSIGYESLDEDYERRVAEGETIVVRNIRTVKLWEYSPVIWGMNPATTTLGVKARFAKEMTPDGPKRRLGDYLVACVRQETMGAVETMLKDGWLSQDERDTCALAVDKCVVALNAALPDELALIEVQPMMLDWMFFFANDPETAQKRLSQKVGRTLSEKNASRIEEAAALLNKVLDDAGWGATEDNTDKSSGPDVPVSADMTQAGPELPPTSQQPTNIHSLLTEIESGLGVLQNRNGG
jgi:HK97 family phage prohead protease